MAATRLGHTRADTLTTKMATLAEFARRGSARVFVGAVVVLGAVRLVLGDLGLGDLIVVVIAVVLVGPVEWLLHRHVLHADAEAWTSRRLGTGIGHRRHHEDPGEIEWVLLGAADAAAVSVVFCLASAAVALPTALVVGTSWVAVWLTSATAVGVAFAHYEWVHLLIHTRYRCRTRLYRRLAANHRRHHYRNEGYWLGVTTNTGDRIAGTLPRSPSDVALSATARRLGSAS